MISAIRITNWCLLQRALGLSKVFEVTVGSKWECQGKRLVQWVNTLLPPIAKSQTSQNFQVCWEAVWEDPDLTCSQLLWRQTLVESYL